MRKYVGRRVNVARVPYGENMQRMLRKIVPASLFREEKLSPSPEEMKRLEQWTGVEFTVSEIAHTQPLAGHTHLLLSTRICAHRRIRCHVTMSLILAAPKLSEPLKRQQATMRTYGHHNCASHRGHLHTEESKGVGNRAFLSHGGRPADSSNGGDEWCPAPCRGSQTRIMKQDNV